MTDAAVYRVREPFTVPGPNGAPRIVQAGKLLSPDDPLVKSHRKLLDPVNELVADRQSVEQATAAPGERRSVTPAKQHRAPKHHEPAKEQRAGEDESTVKESTDD